MTAMDKLWHAEHFQCAKCKLELGALRTFFPKDGKPYCESCFHANFSPTCAGCKKIIQGVRYTSSTPHGFREKEGRPYCKKDYDKATAPMCDHCKMPITENYVGALKKHYHKQCFQCKDCKTPLKGDKFWELSGKPYCELHYHTRNGTLCHGCQKGIDGKCAIAMNRKYHPEHFTCANCNTVLGEGTYRDHMDKPYCHPCFEKLFR
ncbi:TGFB1I1 [Cordylochernes scorpioides]|uniref:TGFB1I1 n=1 Tax=Cordylochernes scorpioides TaxID=51811 RepID=A0ABY6LLX2_9ARAC|nr:TGFB1I1 [Cordylochernes scorpioides]